MATPSIIEAFERAGQGQVFAFYSQLDAAAQQRLLAEAAEIDLAEVEQLNRTLLGKNAASVNLDGLAPAPFAPLPENGGNADEWAKAKAEGEKALRAGRVAAFTVAGGQVALRPEGRQGGGRLDPGYGYGAPSHARSGGCKPPQAELDQHHQHSCLASIRLQAQGLRAWGIP
ncbi:MAG: hypothetical protein ABW051_02485 [Burkholderiaceae bacterium]